MNEKKIPINEKKETWATPYDNTVTMKAKQIRFYCSNRISVDEQPKKNIYMVELVDSLKQIILTIGKCQFYFLFASFSLFYFSVFFPPKIHLQLHIHRKIFGWIFYFFHFCICSEKPVIVIEQLFLQLWVST